jgi:hypothetical protein
MNKDMMKKNVGVHVLLVPPACRLDQHGFELKAVDDDWWLIQDVTNDGVQISDPRTGHFRNLGYDHVHRFTTDGTRNGSRRGFLSLHVQVFVQGNDVRVVPNARPGDPVQSKRPEVFDKIVEIRYPELSGIQERLLAQSYRIGWVRPDRVSSLVDLEGYEVVVEADVRGVVSTFRTRDGLVLLKCRNNKPPAR